MFSKLSGGEIVVFGQSVIDQYLLAGDGLADASVPGQDASERFACLADAQKLQRVFARRVTTIGHP